MGKISFCQNRQFFIMVKKTVFIPLFDITLNAMGGEIHSGLGKTGK